MKGWIKHVARPLTGQSLPMFLLMTAFAAPILEFTGRSENFGFEIVGRPGCGKSTSQLLMASALGGTRNTDSGKYWIAEAFALVYAAGKLAQRYGALPDNWHCGWAALACYRQMLEMSEHRPNFDLLLGAVLRKPGVVDLDCSSLERFDDMAFAAIPAFLKTNQNGRREALFHPPTLEEAIPGWKALINADGVRAVHTHDGDRLTKKRHVRSGTTDRMVCIVLPGDKN